MVAKMTVAERFLPPPEPWIGGRWRLPHFTRADAEAMMRIGIIPEDASTELLQGVIVLKDRASLDQDPTRIGKDHRKCVERLSALRKVIDSEARHVESQQPLVCADIHQPEPDWMVLRGTLDAYPDLATASDAFCVIEVADSSLDRDEGIKLFWYARSGIQQYIVINLRNRTAEVYTHPDAVAGTYPPPQVIPDSGILPLRVRDAEFFDVPLGDVLP
jgi:Uma2 family endonuclease